jgi:DTW domain-containing protein YfiP
MASTVPPPLVPAHPVASDVSGAGASGPFVKAKYASIDPRRKRQVERMLSARPEKESACPKCLLMPRHCACAYFVRAPAVEAGNRVLVSTIVDASEAHRSSSTHRVIAVTCPPSVARTYIFESPEDGGMPEILASILARSKEQRAGVPGAGDGRRTTAFLYPGPGAVPLRTWLDGLPPEEALAGVHLIAIDGSWSEARRISRVIQWDGGKDGGGDGESSVSSPTAASAAAPSFAFVLVEPSYTHALFQPLRRQPQPGRISTAEAVALVFDDYRRWSYKTKGIPAPPTWAPEGAHLPFTPNPPHVHDVVLPFLKVTATGHALRYNVCVLVDALTTQSGMTPPGSYRAWRCQMGRRRDGGRGPDDDDNNGGDGDANEDVDSRGSGAGPYFSRLPAWIIERVLVFAYGADAACEPSGYGPRNSWTRREAEVASRAAREVAAATAAAVTAALKAGSGEGGEGGVPSGTAIVLPPGATPTPRSMHQKQMRGSLPLMPSQYTKTAFALSNSHLYCFAAGIRRLPKMRDDHPERVLVRQRAKEEAEAAAAAAAEAEAT